MKNFLITIAFVIAANIVTAQTKIGIRVGGNMSTAQVVDSGVSQKNHYVNGINAGIFLKVPFEGVLYFSPSINYSRRGYAFTHSTGPVIKTENNVNYVDLIPELSVDFPVGKNKNSFLNLSVGPMLGIAVSGKERNTFANNSVVTSKMIFNYTNFSRFDAGVTGSLSLTLNKLIVGTSYYYGLANVENDESLLRNIQNRSFVITVGYYLK